MIALGFPVELGMHTTIRDSSLVPECRVQLFVADGTKAKTTIPISGQRSTRRTSDFDFFTPTLNDEII